MLNSSDLGGGISKERVALCSAHKRSLNPTGEEKESMINKPLNMRKAKLKGTLDLRI